MKPLTKKTIFFLCAFVCTIVYVNTLNVKASSEPPSKQAMVEHNLITNTTSTSIYEIDPSLDNTDTFFDKIDLRSIIGEDTREPIDSTSEPPFSCIGLLRIKHENGANKIGTGFLVTDRLVLTAAHCVNSKDDGEATTIKFYAGYNGSNDYIGVANATKYFVALDWDSSYNKNYDWAILQLDKPLGQTAGYIPCTTKSSLVGKTSIVVGYPGDYYPVYGDYLQAYGEGVIMKEETESIFYTTDTEGGQSGSPIMLVSGNSLICVGVHGHGVSGNSNYNSGVKINSAILTAIKNNL